MTDTTEDKPTTREESVLAEAIGPATYFKRKVRRFGFWTYRGSIAQKSFETVVAAAMVAVLFWACVSFYVVARDVLHKDDVAGDLRAQISSQQAQLNEAKEQNLQLHADNQDLTEELIQEQQEVCVED